MAVVLPNIAQPTACKLWLQPGLALSGLDHGANYPYNPEIWDLSGNGNHCTMYNQAHTEQSGYRYDAELGLWVLAFDGVDDYCQTNIELPGSDSPRVHSWWMRCSNNDARVAFSCHGIASNSHETFWLKYDIGPMLYRGYGNYRRWVDTPKRHDGQWHYWQLYIPGNAQTDVANCQLWIDGELQTVYDMDSSGTLRAYDMGLRIGQSGGYFFAGEIACFLAYGTALTAEDIAHNYALGIGGYSTTYKLQPRPNVTHDSRVTFALHAAKADGAKPADNANLLATDISGYGKTATPTNFAGTSQSGAKGNGTLNNPYCYAFDGVDDYIATNADSDSAGVHFYEWWMRSDRKSRNTIFSHGDARPWQGVFEIDYYYILPRLYLGTSNWRYWEKTPAQSDGQWHYWQLYYAGSGQDDITKAALWIDGVLQNVNNTMSSGPQQDAGLALCVGKGCSGYFSGDGNGYFAGDIASFRILNYLPTEAERLQAYQQGPYWPVWQYRVCSSHIEECASRVTRQVTAARTTTSHATTMASSVTRQVSAGRIATSHLEPITSSVTRAVTAARVTRSHCEPIVSRVTRAVTMARVVTSYCERIVSRVKLRGPVLGCVYTVMVRTGATINATVRTGITIATKVRKGVTKTVKLQGRRRR